MRGAMFCLLLLLGLGGCTARAVRCEGPLRPINTRAAPQDTRTPPIDRRVNAP